MKDIRVVFMGTPDFSVPVLKGLIENYNVVGVVTQPDKEVGRHKELTYSPVKKVALENNIEVLQPIKIRKEFDAVLAMQPDLIVTCAYGQIIPKEILDYPKYKCINVHASLLPKLRGGAPLHHAIIDGYDKTGITIMYMAEKMDDGDILSQAEIKIDENMTVGELHDILRPMGRNLLLKTLDDLIKGNITPIKQNEEEVTFGYNIKREEELIDFNKTTKEVHNQIRGLSPFPGAYTILDGLEVKIYKSIIGGPGKKEVPGKIINIYKDGIGVQTLDGEVILKEIKVEGKKRMEVKDYLNGTNKEELIKKSFVKE